MRADGPVVIAVDGSPHTEHTLGGGTVMVVHEVDTPPVADGRTTGDLP